MPDTMMAVHRQYDGTTWLMHNYICTRCLECVSVQTQAAALMLLFIKPMHP